jgi:type I restriction enzyme S subunit
MAVTTRRFNRYPVYKDSGIEWLGEVPAHWEVKRLKYVAPACISKMDVKPDEAVYVGLEHVESWTGRLLLDDQPETVDSVVGFFRAGDVLFGKLRPYLAKVARPDFDGVCTSEILPLRPVAECSQSYVMYELLNAPYIRWLDSLTYGTKMPRLSPDQVTNSFVSLPPHTEQRAIAAFLDRETAKIDALVAKKERLIALLQEQRTALITRSVTKGLDPTVPMKDSGVEWLGEIPTHWDVLKTTWLFSIGSGTTPRSEDLGYYGGDTPWITTSELRESVVVSTEKNVTDLALREHSSLKIHPRGSVAIAMYGATIGRLGLLGVPATVNQACCVFSNPRGIDMQFWFYWLQMRRPYLISLGYGGGQPNLSQELLRSIRVSTPPIPEQLAIVAFLDRETAKLDALIAKILGAISRLKEFRTALISATVTGKIDVREGAA